MKKIGFVFRSHPHSSAKGREGLDALLAASAYSENIAVFFIGDGVTQLMTNQNTASIYSRDYVPAFKLMDLYDIEEIYVCSNSLKANGMDEVELVLADAVRLNSGDLAKQLHGCDKLLTF
ncbi:sulfurtransferase complex subunit TusC [Vibrio sp. F74]|uniref:sulfurtransferase complex subunit TusC n=1 Tax=Vibrio sp. F74 TaxID=700020 RepID=UPI0035F557BC